MCQLIAKIEGLINDEYISLASVWFIITVIIKDCFKCQQLKRYCTQGESRCLIHKEEVFLTSYNLTTGNQSKKDSESLSVQEITAGQCMDYHKRWLPLQMVYLLGHLGYLRNLIPQLLAHSIQ